MENAVVYARYSSHNQTEQSIEGQLAAAHKYAEAKGLNIIHEYCDRAKTGTNDNREEFQQMLHDCQSHTFTVIIVWKVDRFGRNREEITFNKYKAKKHGVRVEYIAENISEGPEGVILESVLEGMAEYYSLQLSQNVRRGYLESAKKHKVLGGHYPLGYKRSEDGFYEIDPTTAPAVRLIFDMYESGESIANIIRYLNENGYRSRYGRQFTKNSLPSILKNERYTGTYIFKDQIKEENIIPAIITKEQFQSVQAMMKVKRRMPSHKWDYSTYLLTDKLYCGECGSPMIGKSGYGKAGVKYNYYGCLGHDRKTCDMMPIPQARLEDLVFGEIKRVLSTPEILNEIVDLVWDYYQKDQRQKDQVIGQKTRIVEIEASLKNITKAVEQGMPYSMVQDRMQDLMDERTMLKKCVAEAELSIGMRLKRSDIKDFLSQFSNISREGRGALVKVLIARIYVYKKEAVISLNYGDDPSKVSLDRVRLLGLKQGISINARTILLKIPLP